MSEVCNLYNLNHYIHFKDLREGDILIVSKIKYIATTLDTEEIGEKLTIIPVRNPYVNKTNNISFICPAANNPKEKCNNCDDNFVVFNLIDENGYYTISCFYNFNTLDGKEVIP